MHNLRLPDMDSRIAAQVFCDYGEVEWGRLGRGALRFTSMSCRM